VRILLVNQYFPPDGGSSAHLLGQLAEDLAADHDVRVVAGRPSYRGLESEFTPCVQSLVRVPSTSFSHRWFLGRAGNYVSFVALASVRVVREPRPDIIATLTNPPFLGLVGVLGAARHRSRFVSISHDVFPDLALALGWLRSRGLERWWRRLNGFVRARASCIIVVGRDMAERLSAEGVDPAKLEYVPAWADRQVVDADATRALRAAHGWEGRFVVMHAGNVGLAQNVGVLADLAARVREQQDVLVVVLGDGPARAELERAVRERGLGNLQLLGSMPRPRAQALMAAADLHVISLVPGLWGCATPSKTYGIMAAARPFVAAVDRGSEPARLADEFGCGRWVPAGDGDALADAVLGLRAAPLDEMGERGRRAAERLFVREVATRRANDVFKALLSR
jgi:colanic acid biosynthesis glycosyl transferase WcaI